MGLDLGSFGVTFVRTGISSDSWFSVSLEEVGLVADRRDLGVEVGVDVFLFLGTYFGNKGVLSNGSLTGVDGNTGLVSISIELSLGGELRVDGLIIEIFSNSSSTVIL